MLLLCKQIIDGKYIQTTWRSSVNSLEYFMLIMQATMLGANTFLRFSVLTNTRSNRQK